MTDKDERREAADALYTLIGGSSAGDQWTGARTDAIIPAWQHDVVAKVLAITSGLDIQYLSLSSPDEGNWEIVAFTEALVVHVQIHRAPASPIYSEIQTFPRASLLSIEIVDVDPLPEADEEWPSNLNLIGRYRTATVPLPLDRFASLSNKKDLARLLSSLLADLTP